MLDTSLVESMLHSSQCFSSSERDIIWKSPGGIMVTGVPRLKPNVMGRRPQGILAAVPPEALHSP